MSNSKPLKRGAVILGLMAVAMPTAALASPIDPPGSITATNYVTANLDEGDHINNNRIKFQTKGPTDVRVQQLIFAPGAKTGWHHHPGLVIVAVQSGSVTLTESNCSSTKTFGPGSVFVEGHDDAHEVSSAGGATLYVTFVAPSADPVDFRDEDPKPLCAQEF